MIEIQGYKQNRDLAFPIGIVNSSIIVPVIMTTD